MEHTRLLFPSEQDQIGPSAPCLRIWLVVMVKKALDFAGAGISPVVTTSEISHERAYAFTICTRPCDYRQTSDSRRITHHMWVDVQGGTRTWIQTVTQSAVS